MTNPRHDTVNVIGDVAVSNLPATQPVSIAASVPVTGTFYQATQPVSAASLPLPSDAATQTTLAALDAKVTAVNTGAVVIASSAIPAGASTAAKQDTGNTSLATIAGAVSGAEIQVDVLTLPSIAGSVTANAGTNLNTSALATEAGNLATIAGKDFATQTTLAALNAKVTAVNTGAVVVTSAPTTAVTGTFWQATQPTKEIRSATPAQSTVSVLVTNTNILATNSSRLGATIYNESGAICYVKLGTTASITSYTVQIAIGGYYEVPYGYTGNIDGITVAITAIIRVTELAA